MATIQKERRRRREPDMSMMLGLMDRYGPEAKQRQQLAEREMLLREGQFGLDRTQSENAGNLSAQQLKMLQQQMEMAQAEEDRRGLEFTAQRELDPLRMAELAARIEQQQAQSELAQQQGQLAVDAGAREASMFPMLRERMRADIDHTRASDRLGKTQADAARFASMAGFVQNAGMAQAQMPNMEIDPTIIEGMGMVPREPADPLAFLGQFDELLQTNPPEALRFYAQATPQDQGNLPLTPEQRVSLSAGVAPEDLLRMFQNKPQQQGGFAQRFERLRPILQLISPSINAVPSFTR